MAHSPRSDDQALAAKVDDNDDSSSRHSSSSHHSTHSTHQSLTPNTAAELDDGEEGLALCRTNSYLSHRSHHSHVSSPDEGAASWRNLPHKAQLITLALCRLSEPITQTGLISYLYFFLRSFHAPDAAPPAPAVIARQVGIVSSSFAAAQCITGLLWGRLSDRIGRKPCILFGLLGTAISVLGFGFSTSFRQALFWRILGGCLNGNVGVLRTMVSETVREPRHQARAFLVLPMCFNVGIIVGPMLGGLLAERGFKKWPYALPNVVSAGLLVVSWLAGFLFLQETLQSKAHRRDYGRELGAALTRVVKRTTPQRRSLPHDDETDPLLSKNSAAVTTASPPPPKSSDKPPPFSHIFTRNIVTTLFSFTLIPLHNVAFMNIFTVFLSTPRFPPPPYLTGGLGLPVQKVGFAMSLLGSLGIILQLFLYPLLQARLGLLRSYRLAHCLFPIAYLLVPFCTMLPQGWETWAGISAVLMMQVTARTFALPGSVILLTNSVEEEGILGTVHGVGSSLASAGRTMGPLFGAWAFARGLEKGVGGAVFWGMAVLAALAAGWTMVLREGRGLRK